MGPVMCQALWPQCVPLALFISLMTKNLLWMSVSHDRCTLLYLRNLDCSSDVMIKLEKDWKQHKPPDLDPRCQDFLTLISQCILFDRPSLVIDNSVMISRPFYPEGHSEIAFQVPLEADFGRHLLPRIFFWHWYISPICHQPGFLGYKWSCP